MSQINKWGTGFSLQEKKAGVNGEKIRSMVKIPILKWRLICPWQLKVYWCTSLKICDLMNYWVSACTEKHKMQMNHWTITLETNAQSLYLLWEMFWRWQYNQLRLTFNDGKIGLLNVAKHLGLKCAKNMYNEALLADKTRISIWWLSQTENNKRRNKIKTET